MENAKKRAYEKLPLTINTHEWAEGHIQGIAVDLEKGFIYYSFTTLFVKSDLDGNIKGTVKGLTGHLGCISFNNEDGKVYGSLEYKHDSIGSGIMQRTGAALADEDAFYIAIFDVDRIDRMDMDAETDGVMTAVYLPEVVDDYSSTDKNGEAHRYGCSGVDGTAIGPVPGDGKDGKTMLFMAYGIYGTLERTDTENQVIMQFDWRKFADAAKPLSQLAPHHSGLHSDKRYFLYTGNTTWGVQNIEYDPFTGDYIVAVYKGKKPCYPNHPMYIIDGSVAPREAEIYGRDGERGLVLTLKKVGDAHESGIFGLEFPYGQTGVFAVGDGTYYYSEHATRKTEDGTRYHSSTVRLYRLDGTDFVPVTE